MFFGRTQERRQEVIFGLALLVTVVLSGAALEAGFRAYKARTVDWAGMVREIGQNEAGTDAPRFKPGSTFEHLSFNRFGLRGPEVVVPAPTDMVRVAFVGDSKMMSANYPEEQTLSAQTVALLAERVPHCRFDYVTIAGPSYTLTLLADLWNEVAPQVEPDLAVMLAGPVTEMTTVMLGAERSAKQAEPVRETWVDQMLTESLLLPRIRWRLTTVSTLLSPAPPLDLDTNKLVSAHHVNFAPLAAALKSTPVLALGYRSRLRRDQPPELQSRYARQLLLAAPGLTVAEALELTDLNVVELQNVASAAKWHYRDLLSEMQADDSHYFDDHHFSDTGLGDLADRIAAELVPHIRPDCTFAPVWPEYITD